MNAIGNILGEICKTIFPIEEEVFFGNKKSSIGICTLSSIFLLNEIKNSELMEKVSIVGRLLSENRGIDSLIQSVISNHNLKIIIVCGEEVMGHKAGNALILLHKNGINAEGRIIGSQSPEPIIFTKPDNVKKFQNQVTIINKIGISNFYEIKQIINSLKV